MTRREALGLLLLAGLVAAGRLIRRNLLMGPDDRWRDPAFLAELVPEPPREEEAPPPLEPPFAVNVVGVDTLVHLPGVGPVLAGRIVASREAEGPFRDAVDLRRVKGIGPRMAARLDTLLIYDASPAARDSVGSSPAAKGR